MTAHSKHIRQFHDDGFDLERPDAVTGRLDDIVCSADIEEVAVFIAPCGVAGVIYAAAPRFAGLLFVAVIAHEEAAGRVLIGTDDNFARFADRRRRAVRQDERLRVRDCFPLVSRQNIRRGRPAAVLRHQQLAHRPDRRS